MQTSADEVQASIKIEGKLTDAVRDMRQVSNFIREIAAQTNLLTLNSISGQPTPV